MCGLAGFAGSGELGDCHAMTAALMHRGPDAEGYHSDAAQGVYLGHRRLIVRDAAGGAQPMFNEDGTVCVVFNGEIYNHDELRRRLENAGHRFRSSHSDTEVLVHGWEEWGDEMPAMLNGMFAFVIYDAPRRHLFGARDRCGEKPLYYALRRGTFLFASELSSLMAHRGFEARLDMLSLQKFFAHGFLPAPNAMLEGARKLPGGSSFSYDLAAGSLQVRRWWRFILEPDATLETRGEDDLAAELRHLLGQAVRRRLVSDVPLGVFLSGGIDSSAVLSLAAAQSNQTVRTFTIGFDEPSWDESGYAREVARLVGSSHAERKLDLATLRERIDDVLGALDEPQGDASILPTRLLSEFTREHVTVALSGDGGDELFAGYDPFEALEHAQRYASLVPSVMHRSLRRLADFMPISTRNMSLDFKLRRALGGLSYPPSLWNPVWLAPLEPAALADIFETPCDVEQIYSEALEVWSQNRSGDMVDRTLEFYTNLYLPDDILTKVDRATMSVSLESRAVFLDNDVVDFCQRLPRRFKFNQGRRKILLKKALVPLLPPSILERKKKGFGMPLALWLRQVPARPPLETVAGIRMQNVARCWEEHRRRSADHRLFLWSWLSLQHFLPRLRFDRVPI